MNSGSGKPESDIQHSASDSTLSADSCCGRQALFRIWAISRLQCSAQLQPSPDIFHVRLARQGFSDKVIMRPTHLKFLYNVKETVLEAR